VSSALIDGYVDTEFIQTPPVSRPQPESERPSDEFLTESINFEMD